MPIQWLVPPLGVVASDHIVTLVASEGTPEDSRCQNKRKLGHDGEWQMFPKGWKLTKGKAAHVARLRV